jgi:hypothetical protein
VTPERVPADPWATATFDGNEREQLQRLAKLTFEKKIEWLEQAYRISHALQQSRIALSASQTVRGNGNIEDLG